ncbi:hypothetical protein CEXT_493481 [Caerostris extrusa]|uniref:Uncharacterized protein n=1 Tax=Caerostris extrusa TaxID=172846 RepID=A0AAV4N123_CAEEX|nr:hypothetical protein CEXT_493481 [Caerostris extrusa]
MKLRFVSRIESISDLEDYDITYCQSYITENLKRSEDEIMVWTGISLGGHTDSDMLLTRNLTRKAHIYTIVYCYRL